MNSIYKKEKKTVYIHKLFCFFCFLSLFIVCDLVISAYNLCSKKDVLLRLFGPRL